MRSGARSGRFVLGFSSEVYNAGAGALVIEATRSGARMTARQIVEGPGDERHDLGAVGVLHYERAGGHEHWHLEDFDRYELIASRPGTRRRSHKAGFCLGDRRTAPDAARTPSADRRFINRCGLNRPRLTRLRQGISPGWSDIYRAHLEGQSIDISGLHSGLYVLCHRLNAQRALAESSYEDNAASLLIRLTRRGHRRPRVEIERRCAASEDCAVRMPCA